MTTSLLMVLFDHNQPYGEALGIPCDVVLELLEAKLEERLSYLDEDKSRLAKKELAVRKEFGSMEAFTKAVFKEKVETPKL